MDATGAEAALRLAGIEVDPETWHEVRAIAAAEAERERRALRRSASDTLRAAYEAQDFNRADNVEVNRQVVLNKLDFPQLSASEIDAPIPLVDAVVAAWQEVSRVADGSVEEQIAALERLKAAFTEAAQFRSDISAREDAELETINAILKSRYDELAILNAGQIAGEQMLATLVEENEINRAILRNGEDSLRVRALRNEAARRQLETELETLGVTGELADKIRTAFEEQLALSNIDIASGIGAGATEAERLANALGIAVGNAVALANVTPDMADEDAVMSQPVLPDANAREKQRRAVANFARLTKPSGGGSVGSGGGGGGGGAGAQIDAISRLIERQKTELELLRTTDPVQKEMIRNREALAGATDAERAAVTQLIAERIAEKERLDDLKDAHDDLVRSIDDSLRRVVFEGGSLEDIFTGLADAIAEAAWQAAALGDGLGAGILGTKDSGGFVGMLADGLLGLFGLGLPGRAEGGMIHGPGGPTDDKVLMWGSNGEFVVNAGATSKYRQQLETINSGGLPAFASGGMIGAGAAGGSAPAPVVELVNASGTPLTTEREDTVDAQGRRRTRIVLANAVGDALTTPGGGARRALRDTYGVQPRGTRR